MTDPRAERLRRRKIRRRRRRVSVAVVLLAAALVIVVATPWFGHLGLSWPWHGGSAAGVRVLGADEAWHAHPVILRFRTSDGAAVTMRWRLDGGTWQEGRRARVAAPSDHANDGVHVVEYKPIAGGAGGAVRVRIDTTAPEVGDLRVTPASISRPTSVHASFTIAATGAGVTAEWAVVDALGAKVGAGGSVDPVDGPHRVTWSTRTAAGPLPPPGTYWLSVVATDAAGNRTEARAGIRCEYPVKARVIRSLPAAGRLVALTFDGGSGYAWRHIMNTLHRHGFTGTFFCTGVSVERYPEMARLAVAQGQTIGNHSFDHPDFTTISHAEKVRQLTMNADAWWRAARATPAPFFRPPYGSYDADTLKAAGETGYRYVVMWDVDTGDWTGLSSAQVAHNAVAQARPGSIIVMHTEWNSAGAIEQILAGLKKKGLKPVNLAQLVAAAGLK